MAFNIKQNGDISKFECDVIINSLGVDTENYGGICKSIIKAVKSPELEDILASVNDFYIVGDYFVTEGYGLNVKNIIHLLSPLAENDKDMNQYKECIRKVLNECQSRGLYRVGIPKIGAGANGYNDKDIENVLSDMCDAYCNIYPKMEITLVLPNDNLSFENRERLRRAICNERQYHNEETLKKFKTGSFKFKKGLGAPLQYDKKYFAYEKFVNGREDIVVKTNRNITMISEYVDEYIKACVEKEKAGYLAYKVKDNINRFFGYGSKSNDDIFRIGTKKYYAVTSKYTAERETFYKIILALKMSEGEARAFLHFFGSDFYNPGFDEQSDAVLSLVKNRQYDLVSINAKFKNIKKGLFD